MTCAKHAVTSTWTECNLPRISRKGTGEKMPRSWGADIFILMKHLYDLYLYSLYIYIFAATAATKMLPLFAGCCSLAVYRSIKIPGSFLALPNLFALFTQLSFWKMVQSEGEPVFPLSLQVNVEPWLKQGFYFWWALIEWHWVGVLQLLWQRWWVLNKYPLCFSDEYVGG